MNKSKKNIKIKLLDNSLVSTNYIKTEKPKVQTDASMMIMRKILVQMSVIASPSLSRTIKKVSTQPLLIRWTLQVIAMCLGN